MHFDIQAQNLTTKLRFRNVLGALAAYYHLEMLAPDYSPIHRRLLGQIRLKTYLGPCNFMLLLKDYNL